MAEFTLGELLQGMAPGQNVQGYPQFQPPFNIPAVPQPAAPPMVVSPPPGPTQTSAPNTLVPPGSAGAPQTPQVLKDAGAFINGWLEANRARWAEEDRTAYEEARSKEAVGGGITVPPETSTPNVLKKPGEGSMPSMPSFSSAPAPTPARGQAEMQGAGPEPTMFDVYGAPVPSRRPLDLGQLMYDVPLPERRTGGAPPPSKAPVQKPQGQARPAAATPSPAGTGGGGGGRASRPTSSFQGAPNTDDPFFATGQPLFDPLTAKFLMQTGLSMMVPKWGGPMANIAQGVGEGAEAVTRSEKQTQESAVTQKKLELEQARINKMGLGRGKKGATESSSSKKLKTPMQQFAQTLSPEGGIFFAQRIKDLNKTDEENGETADQKMARIMQETQTVDRRARAGRGMARSDEIPDTLLDKVAGTPQETTALNAVAQDPVQRALVVSRLEAIKAKKAAASGGTQ